MEPEDAGLRDEDSESESVCEHLHCCRFDLVQRVYAICAEVR